MTGQGTDKVTHMVIADVHKEASTKQSTSMSTSTSTSTSTLTVAASNILKVGIL